MFCWSIVDLSLTIPVDDIDRGDHVVGYVIATLDLTDLPSIDSRLSYSSLSLLPTYLSYLSTYQYIYTPSSPYNVQPTDKESVVPC